MKNVFKDKTKPKILLNKIVIIILLCLKCRVNLKEKLQNLKC